MPLPIVPAPITPIVSLKSACSTVKGFWILDFGLKEVAPILFNSFANPKSKI
jgi:hypothetical protein